MAQVLLPRSRRHAAAASEARAERPERHPGDLLRVGLGLAVLGVGFLLAQQGELTALERDLFRLVNDLPGFVLPVVWALMQLGNVVAVPTLAAVAALFRRFRLARDVLASGILGYFAADLVKSVVGRERPAGLPVGAVLHEGAIGGAGFISGHATVAAAMATAAAPYLTRRARRVAWTLAWIVGLARIYVGAHLPLDVVGGLAAGWAIGSLVHWVLGVPRWRPSVAGVTALLARYGLLVENLRPASVEARSSHAFTAVAPPGRDVFVKVLDPDRYERDWLFRLARLLAVRDVKDADALAPLGRQAEHEAVAMLHAHARGVRVPEVLVARGSDRGAVIAMAAVPGRALDSLPPEELTPELLRRVWEQVALLQAARIAHRDLVASSLVVDPEGLPWVVDFGNAETGADDVTIAGDVAELMASLVTCAGRQAVVTTALEALGRDAVTAALPGLAPLALSRSTRTSLRRRPTALGELRAELRGRLGPPDPARLQFGPAGPFAWSAITAAALLVLGGLAWTSGAADVAETMETSGWRWLGGALALVLLARGATAAAAEIAVDRRLPLGRVFAATVAADGATLRRGPVDRRRVAARFLERSGVLPSAAERAIDRFDVGAVPAALVVAVGASVLAWLDGTSARWRPPPGAWSVVLIGVGGFALVVLGQLLASRHGGHATRTPLRRTLLGLPGSTWRKDGQDRATARHRWVVQVAWAAVGVALEASALAAILHGLHGRVPVLTTVSIYALLRLAWAALPVSGAPGLAEAELLLALTAAGAPVAAAGASVLAVRILIFWLPAALGWALSGRLEHRMLL